MSSIRDHVIHFARTLVISPLAPTCLNHDTLQALAATWNAAHWQTRANAACKWATLAKRQHYDRGQGTSSMPDRHGMQGSSYTGPCTLCLVPHGYRLS